MGKELVGGDVDFYSLEIPFTPVCCIMVFLTVWISQHLNFRCCSSESSVKVSSFSDFFSCLTLKFRKVCITRNIPDFMYTLGWYADKIMHFQKKTPWVWCFGVFFFFFVVRGIRIVLLWVGSIVRVSSGDNLSFLFGDVMFLTVMNKKWNLF